MRSALLTLDGDVIPDGEPAAADPLPCLGLRVELAQGYALRHLFALLERHPALKRLNEFLEPCAAEAAKAPPAGCVTDLFDRLELSRTVELIGHPGRPRLEIYMDLRGVGGGDSQDIRMTALEGLLDMPLKLGKLRHVVFGDKVRMLEFETSYSLYEVLEGVGWQLGFHTAPKQCSLRR